MPHKETDLDLNGIQMCGIWNTIQLKIERIDVVDMAPPSIQSKALGLGKNNTLAPRDEVLPRENVHSGTEAVLQARKNNVT
jgi:hypothetical protein